MNDPNKPDSGPGCVTILFAILGYSLIVLMVIASEMRLQRIENKLGMPNCGIFNSATWDGHTCKEPQK